MTLIEKIKAFVDAKADSSAIHHSDFLNNDDILEMAKQFIAMKSLIDNSEQIV